MVRRILLTLVLVVLGLVLIDGALVGQASLLPVSLPEPLLTVHRYVGGDGVGGVASAVVGVAMLVTAWNPSRYREGVAIAVLLGVLTVVMRAALYYRGESGATSSLVFWVAGTALLMALFPGRPRTSPATPRPLPR